MPSPQNREESLLAAALVKPPGERAIFLDGACYGDPALRQRLEALLAAHDKPEPVPPSPGNPGVAATMKLDLAEVEDEAVGKTIGRYKVLEKVGEGGCGVVYVAEQTEPVRRRVALKVIKLGMDTKQVVARFEAERQALAMMDHPNIAKVLDAGATEAGRPFFVMELVRGIKITDYCDQHNLTTTERLDLFIKVCQAIQHAHQKGIIHRDIKPSNILVTMHDGVPVPKVIDFGIAKATTGQTLTDKTVYTQLQQFIGTPAYMSPEQAEMSGLDIDTRSDIYALGVLLYELLTGKTPFDSTELLQSGLDGMRRTIREREPARPSTRMSTMLDADCASAAKHQKLDSRKLISVLRGDLDWIVMKALEKDRTRRYETANGLGADVRRYLTSEPVIARPPSNLYRFQKLARRNKTVFAAVSAGLAALVLGLALSLYLFLQEREARKRAVAAEKRAEGAAALETKLREGTEVGAKYTQAGMLLSQGKYQEAENIMNTVSVHHPSGSAIFNVLGLNHARSGEWQAAISNYSKVVELLPDDHMAYFVLAPLYLQVGDLDGYRKHRERILLHFGGTSEPQFAERLTKACLLLPPSPVELETVNKMAAVAMAAGPKHPAWVYFQFAKGFADYRSGRFEEAARLLQQVIDHEGHYERTAQACLVLAMAQQQLNQPEAARAALAKGINIAEANLPKPSSRDLGEVWHDVLIIEILTREAQSLVQPKT